MNNKTDLRVLNLRLKALATTIDEDQKTPLPGTGEEGGKSLNGELNRNSICLFSAKIYQSSSEIL